MVAGVGDITSSGNACGCGSLTAIVCDFNKIKKNCAGCGILVKKERECGIPTFQTLASGISSGHGRPRNRKKNCELNRG